MFNNTSKSGGEGREDRPQMAVTIAEAARMVSVSQRYMQQLTTDGIVPSFKVGRCRRIPVKALCRWTRRECRKQAGGKGHPPM
jgi:excisionase family DNA binding protein